MDPTISLLRSALSHSEEFIRSLDEGPVAAKLSSSDLRGALQTRLGNRGDDPEAIIDDLAGIARDGMIRSPGGRFFGWVMGGSLPSALAADWLVSVWDQNAAAAAAAPGACVIEEIAAAWLKDLFGLPASASYAFTTGCQMAHATCLAAARHGVLQRAGFDVERVGLRSSPPVRILTGSHRHSSVERAIRLLGFGLDSMTVIPEDADGRLAPDLLAEQLANGQGPAIVILHAGDLNIGACDPFVDLIPIAKSAGAWVHVDGAFGLWLKASRKRRSLVDGLELADSWATDAHKWLNVPYDSGIAFVRDAASHRAAMEMEASYVAKDPMIRDPIDYTPEWSRRARAIPIYAALRELGRKGLSDLIDRSCDLTFKLATAIGGLDGAELVRVPTVNQALVRFPDPRPGASEADHDRRTAKVVELVRQGGEAFFTDTVWRGRRAMRISLVNWRTTETDVERSVAAVATALRCLNAELPTRAA